MTYIPDPYTQGIVNDRDRAALDAEAAKHRAETQTKYAEIEAAHQKSQMYAMEDFFEEEIAKKDAIIAAKDALILEWMHTNAAFKKLTKDYAARLGITNEERHADVDQARVDVAVQSPAFKTTELYKEALALVEKHKSEGTS